MVSKQHVGTRCVDDYPRFCRHCGEQQVVLDDIPYSLDVKHDGRVYQVSIDHLQIPICRNCGERSFDESVDEQVNAALRAQLGLLSPSDIRASLKSLGITQKEAAAALGIAEATLSRWVGGGQIQSKGMDNFLRVYFESPDVRKLLGRAKLCNGLESCASPKAPVRGMHRETSISDAQWPIIDATRTSQFSKAQAVIERGSTWSSADVRCA